MQNPQAVEKMDDMQKAPEIVEIDIDESTSKEDSLSTESEGVFCFDH